MSLKLNFKIKASQSRLSFVIYSKSVLKNKYRAIQHYSFFQGTSTGCHKLTTVEVIVTSSLLYKLTFFPTDCQTNI